MKTNWITSIMALALGASALAQTAAPAAALPGQPVNPTQTGRIPGGGGFGMSTQPRGTPAYATRLNSIVSSAPASSPASVIAFEPHSQKQIGEMQEDLQVLGLIVQRALERAMGDKTTEYRLGVPMLLRAGGSFVQTSYLDGFGVLIKMHVPFPVAATGEEPKAKKDPTAAETEWEKARQALYGGPGENDLDPSSAPPAYDERLVTALKKQLLEALKNGSNLRHVKSDEWISVAIAGGGTLSLRPTQNAPGAGANPYDSGSVSRTQGTVLAMRVKKSALSGSVDEIEKAVQVNAYLDLAAERPVSSGYTYGSPSGAAKR
jgi:hypothetical protein